MGESQPVERQTAAPFYRPLGKEVEVFEHAVLNRLPVLLKGPTGTGKSRFVEYMAVRLGRDLVTVSCHEEMSAVDLVGRYLVQGDSTVWMDGPLSRAVRQGAMIYLDELAEARPDTIVALHSLTDHRRTLFIDRRDEAVKAHDSFVLVASYNPGYQRGFKEIKPSTKQRFVSMSFGYPAANVEIEIICGEAGVDAKCAARLVKLGGKIRNLTELGLAETASTRLLVDAANLIRTGLPPRLAAEVAIAEPLTDDGDTLTALRDVIALML